MLEKEQFTIKNMERNIAMSDGITDANDLYRTYQESQDDDLADGVETGSRMLDYKLYEVAPVISEIIRNNTDYETGEINENAVEEIIALEQHAEFKIHNCGQVLRRAHDNVKGIDEQRRKLLDEKNKILKEASRLEEYVIRCAEILHIDKVVMDGKTTEIKMSRESVVGDLEKCDPDFIVEKISKSIDKRAVLRVWKSEDRVVDGCEIVKRKIVKI